MSADDPPSVEEYGRLAAAIIDSGNVALALAMAKETGIVKVLSDADSPLSCNEISEKANLKDRYVLELLGALVSARLLQLAPGTGGEEGVEPKYLIHPPLKKAFKKAGARVMFVTGCVQQFKAIKEVFSKDGPSSPHSNEHDSAHHSHDYTTMDEMNELTMEDTLEALLSAPGLREKLEKGIEVAELGCGTGLTSLRLAAMFPNSRFTLTEVLQGPLDRAKASAQSQNITNVTFQTVDATKLPPEWKGKFDWMFAAFVLHHVADKQMAVNKVSESLRSGGYFSVLEALKSDCLKKNVGSMESAALFTLAPFFLLPHAEPGAAEPLGFLGQESVRNFVEQAGLRVLGFRKFNGNVSGSEVCICQKD